MSESYTPHLDRYRRLNPAGPDYSIADLLDDLDIYTQGHLITPHGELALPNLLGFPHNPHKLSVTCMVSSLPDGRLHREAIRRVWNLMQTSTLGLQTAALHVRTALNAAFSPDRRYRPPAFPSDHENLAQYNTRYHRWGRFTAEGGLSSGVSRAFYSDQLTTDIKRKNGAIFRIGLSPCNGRYYNWNGKKFTSGLQIWEDGNCTIHIPNGIYETRKDPDNTYLSIFPSCRGLQFADETHLHSNQPCDSFLLFESGHALALGHFQPELLDQNRLFYPHGNHSLRHTLREFPSGTVPVFHITPPKRQIVCMAWVMPRKTSDPYPCLTDILKIAEPSYDNF